ncbi:MAG: IPT/TIG domain-containing protein, partial [Odoribacter sp.]|nr:IPT/TIG domain-containing protein [Odoribacter sp.]
MKKIWFMLLLVCSACAFTACSDDDEKTPEAVAPTATMPEKISIGREVTIEGKDFADNAKLTLKSETETIELKDAKFTATSVTFTLPVNTKPGSYQVIVNQNDKDYVLGNVEVSDFPITDLLMPSKIKTGEKTHIFGEGFTESDKLILQSNSEQKIEIGDADFNDKEASFTLSYAFMAGNYSLLLIQNEKEYKLGDLEIEENTTIITPITKRISKITYADGSGDVNYTLHYADNQIERIEYSYQSEGETIEETVYNISYSANQILINHEDETIYTYTLSNGNVEKCTDNGESVFNWDYNSENYLSQIIEVFRDVDDEGEEIVEESPTNYTYDNGNLVDIEGVGVDFNKSSLKNISQIDMVACIYKFIIGAIS